LKLQPISPHRLVGLTQSPNKENPISTLPGKYNRIISISQHQWFGTPFLISYINRIMFD
jgi:hypothetical protein